MLMSYLYSTVISKEIISNYGFIKKLLALKYVNKLIQTDTCI